MLAIIPLAKLLGFGTEEIAMRVGQTLGGLLNATLGNAVELIVAILALVKCELVVVQSSLLGSILRSYNLERPQDPPTIQFCSRSTTSYNHPELRRWSSHPEPMEEEDEEEVPSLNAVSAIILLGLSTALVGVTSEWLVDSINGITRTGVISEAWVGLILLPIVGNAAEHLTAVSVSVKDKLDLSMAVAVGSSIQIALFVVPLLVILGWIMDKPLTLLFDPFVLIVNYTTAERTG
ncbi:hypothetical protein PGTUg99_004773 [Puccinia graminis f. sp. tritici]|uniref:Sodium/calcium exchanger membrane region domain-containing protein n=1 Tax=Puccinia graminis f. sp. tritici TaxID=56615 RepID=A0A5B0M1X6_PUCGR|nr:hypothetical protein PGTUg99_004773 [Puccinia graminis f. sp. tritici]